MLTAFFHHSVIMCLLASFWSPVWNLSYHQHLVLNQHLALHQGLVFHQHLVLIDTIIAGLEYGMEWTKEWTVHAPNALVVDLPCFPEILFGRAKMVCSLNDGQNIFHFDCD